MICISEEERASSFFFITKEYPQEGKMKKIPIFDYALAKIRIRKSLLIQADEIISCRAATRQPAVNQIIIFL